MNGLAPERGEHPGAAVPGGRSGMSEIHDNVVTKTDLRELVDQI